MIRSYPRDKNLTSQPTVDLKYLTEGTKHGKNSHQILGARIFPLKSQQPNQSQHNSILSKKFVKKRQRESE